MSSESERLKQYLHDAREAARRYRHGDVIDQRLDLDLDLIAEVVALRREMEELRARMDGRETEAEAKRRAVAEQDARDEAMSRLLRRSSGTGMPF
jgi:hypothetical protein